MTEFSFPEGCPEVSGMGGKYEQACRSMVVAGMQWIRSNPSAELVSTGYYGKNSPDMDALEAHLGTVVDGATGAMMGCTLNHILFAHKNGWNRYLEELSAPRI